MTQSSTTHLMTPLTTSPSVPPVSSVPSDLESAINDLRIKRRAVILAHYYQEEDIQDIADFVGDSLDLSRRAAATDADVIVFCGVRFMAEVAKILSPERMVLVPDMNAGCSLEESCPPERFRQFRAQHPHHLALTYINCSAEVKALSDIIVTSSNALKIIEQIPVSQPILFAPDQHLGRYLQKKSGRPMVLWPGTCIVHEQFSEKALLKMKHRHPKAVVSAHPECPDAILTHADHIGSTSSMLHFVRTSPHDEIIVATESHIIHQMRKIAPDKTFYEAPGPDAQCSCAQCPYMAMNSMEKLYTALATMQPQVTIASQLREAASKPLRRMLDMSPPPRTPC